MKRQCPICRERGAGCWVRFGEGRAESWVVYCASPDARPPKWYREITPDAYGRRFAPRHPAGPRDPGATVGAMLKRAERERAAERSVEARLSRMERRVRDLVEAAA